MNAQRLRELLTYEPETGIFTRRVDRCSFKAGEQAGYTDPGGYLWIRVDAKLYAAARLAWLYMTAEWPKHNVDHRDRVPSNNAWSNLREATQSQNLANTTLSSRSSSGFKGVHRLPSGRFMAKCNRRHLGCFETAEAAHAAYINAARAVFGEFACGG